MLLRPRAPRETACVRSKPRFVAHIDRRAIGHITDLYAGLLRDGMRDLDLMSAGRSHLPANLTLGGVTGLGMNTDELAALCAR